LPRSYIVTINFPARASTVVVSPAANFQRPVLAAR
jgi:hypothetical protein